jgi:hypothetical protein
MATGIPHGFIAGALSAALIIVPVRLAARAR